MTRTAYYEAAYRFFKAVVCHTRNVAVAGVDAANVRRTLPGAPFVSSFARVFQHCPNEYIHGAIGYGRRVSAEIRFDPKLTKSTFNGFSQIPPWVDSDKCLRPKVSFE